MIKTLLLAGAASLGAAGAALAQDAGGATVAAFQASPSSPWAGPYVGLNAGYGWDVNSDVRLGAQDAAGAASLQALARPPATFQTRSGYTAGGQVGWNVQRGDLVAGVEADAWGTDLGDKSTYLSPANTGGAPAGVRSDFASRTDYVGTVRGRLGVSHGPLLVYGTGGWAYGEVRDRATLAGAGGGAPVYVADHSYNPTGGWAAGAGVEYALPMGFMGHRATLRAEYLHYDLGDKTLNVAASDGSPGYDARFEHAGDVVRGGVNFKFWAPYTESPASREGDGALGPGDRTTRGAMRRPTLSGLDWGRLLRAYQQR